VTAALELVTGPVNASLTLAEAKAQLRIDFDDDDTLLTNLIHTAEAHVDGLGDLGRAMITQTWAQYENQSPGWVRLHMTPVQSLTSVEYYDADGVLQTATLSDFELWRDGDFMVCKPKDGAQWPTADSRPDAIKITYVAGFGDASTDIPENIRQAMLMLIAHLYENREAATEAKLMSTPMGYDMLMNNQRVGWYG